MSEAKKKDISEISGPELQVELAIIRTSLALDRTLLAWIRTSLTFVGFGFTLAKFIGDLTKTGQIEHSAFSGLDSPRTLGIIMMLVGLVGLIGGAVDHWRAEKRLTTRALTVSPWSVSFFIAVLLAAFTVILMVILAFETKHNHWRLDTTKIEEPVPPNADGKTEPPALHPTKE